MSPTSEDVVGTWHGSDAAEPSGERDTLTLNPDGTFSSNFLDRHCDVYEDPPGDWAIQPGADHTPPSVVDVMFTCDKQPMSAHYNFYLVHDEDTTMLCVGVDPNDLCTSTTLTRS